MPKKRRPDLDDFVQQNVPGGVRPKGQETDFFNPSGTTRKRSGRNMLGKSRRSSKFNDQPPSGRNRLGKSRRDR